MHEHNTPLAREDLEQMTTEQLDELLNGELERETPNGDTVRLILGILWEREKDMPVEMTPKIKKAWAKYQRDIARIDASEKRSGKFRGWILKTASAAAVLALLVFAVPQRAGADSFFDKLARLTDSIVEFFSPGMANDNVTEYVFETDNPGLQQVYDTVAGLGVTEPVVPMWLPEGYELVECKVVETSHKKGIAANFRDGENGLSFRLDIHSLDVSHEYHWSGETITEYERAGISHTVMRNFDRWSVAWFINNMECFLTLDCQEDILYKILDSIYVMEDKQ